MALPPDREAAPPWQVLIGPFAAEHVEAELEHGGPLLLVPNDRERADALAQEFVGRGGGRLFFSRDLLAGEDGETCWYRYSDARFDGVTPPEDLHHLAPNLRLRDLELRPVVRLDSLIHSWANRDSALAAVVSAGGGRLWLQSKQPVPIVAGVSRVLEVIGEVCWTPLGSPVDPPAGPASLERVAQWLESSGFQPAERRPVHAQCAAPSLVWRQDRLQRAAARQQQLEREIERLREEQTALRQEHTALRQEGEGLRASLAQAEARQAALIEQHGAAQARWQAESQIQRQEAAVVREAAAAERSRLEGDVARLEGERARLQGQGVWLEGEAARWAGEGASLRQELGEARAEGEALRQQILVLQRGLDTQREQLLAEAAQERVAREAEIGRLGLENVVLRQAAEALRQEAAGQQQEVAGQRQELEAARAELEAARQELESLRREKEEQRQALLAEAAAAVAAAELRAEAAAQAAGAAAAEAAAQAAAQAAAERDWLAAEIDRLGQENAHRQQEAEALLEGARLEIAAILDLLDPAEILSPDGDAPAAP